MQWETPAFTEIDMSAEIGAYQSDFDQDRGDDGRFATPVVGGASES
jgi:coenzyme PQQ precursor peptide PqqA